MNKKLYINIFIGIAIILIDQVTKILLINKYITIIPNVLDFTYTENTGAAFGIGTNNIIIVLSILIISMLIVYIIKNDNKIYNFLPFTLIISGAIGNLIDRIFKGYVIDFIDVNLFNYPNFNIADTSIVIGIIFLIISILRKVQKNEV